MRLHLDRRAVIASLLVLAACGEETADAPDTQTAPVIPPPEPARITDQASLQVLLDSQVAETGVPSVAAAVFDRERFLLNAASGVRILGQPDPVTTNDPWHIGSCTKAMTAALYARLADQGRADWGATLPELLPDLAGEIDPAFAATPIEALLRHRSGLGDVGPAWLMARRYDRRPFSEQRTDSAREFLSKPPAKNPGEYSYSNVGYIVVGAAIERITGKSWEASIREHVFAPLKMNRTGFGPPQPPAPRGHRSGPLEILTPMGTDALADNPFALGPAGTVHAPFEDWTNFARIFFDPQQTFLSPGSLEQLVTPADGQDYALGWGVRKHPEGGNVLVHVGSNTMWVAQVAIARDRGVAFFTAANAGGPRAERVNAALARSLMTSITGG